MNFPLTAIILIQSLGAKVRTQLRQRTGNSGTGLLWYSTVHVNLSPNAQNSTGKQTKYLLVWCFASLHVSLGHCYLENQPGSEHKAWSPPTLQLVLLAGFPDFHIATSELAFFRSNGGYHSSSLRYLAPSARAANTSACLRCLIQVALLSEIWSKEGAS